jgi:beta-glucosidase-like glycosyl hydrolase
LIHHSLLVCFCLWIGNLFGGLTIEQKIGQLFIIPVCEMRGEDHFEDVEKLIREGKVGGILCKQGTVAGQRALIDRLQKLSSMPLLCLQDGEYGVAMRLTDAPAFPRNLTLGAIQDLSLLYRLGQQIGQQCRLAGAHANLAPVVDVNSNPSNPIIHMRSFGDDPLQVVLRAEQVMRGIQSTGVLACAKHFPGHGDTAVDSHCDLPSVNRSWEELTQIELFPFQQLVKAGVAMVLSAHLAVPALAEISSLPATFSRWIMADLLQTQWGFQGLLITDALNMKALSNRFTAGEIALGAFHAGHDLLLYGDHIAPHIDKILRSDVPEAFAALMNACETGEIAEEELDRRLNKILRVKEAFGLFEDSSCPPIPDLEEQLYSEEVVALNKQLYGEAMTLVYDDGFLPITQGEIAYVAWGESPELFGKLSQALHLSLFSLDDPALLTQIKDNQSVLLALSKGGTVLADLRFTQEEEKNLQALAEQGPPTVALLLTSPYLLPQLPRYSAAIEAYENSMEAQEAIAAIVLGLRPAKGILPILRSLRKY